jgi:hypothetical protein
MAKTHPAETPQAGKWPKKPLRNFRKHKNGQKSLCGSSANTKTAKFRSAETPQVKK